ncbi:uncharacterized protein LOC127700590 [Mytilus californianus]|uniref:uncharacterized protein LOC127700590 n=1 Tax=Mytilus californianus TaxID=6549 RepID=UPI002247A671|nr:uncharacterized protein LOC127700590 [Mytilus californianus]
MSINKTNTADPLITQEAPDQPSQRNPTYPVRTFKVFGGIQIGLGVILGIICLIAVITDAMGIQNFHDCLLHNEQLINDSIMYWSWRRYYKSEELFSFDIVCLICCGWFVLTGFLPMCMSRKRQSSWRSLKIGFMVCSIIGASIFSTTSIILGINGVLFRLFYGANPILSAFIVLIALVEAIVATVAASFCCCCSPWEIPSEGQAVVFVNGTQPGMITNAPQTQVPMDSPIQITTGQTIVQYPSAQQCQIVNKNELSLEQISTSGRHQTSTVSSSEQQVFDTSPPAYKE